MRVRALPYFRTYLKQEVPEFFALIEKMIKDRNWSAPRQKTYREKGWKAARALIKLPFEEILVAEPIHPELPDYAPIVQSAICPGCGEEIMASKFVETGINQNLCLMCGGHKYFQVEGQGIVAKG